MKKVITTALLLLTASDIYALEQYQGVLHWGRRVELSIPVSGLIESIAVKVGDKVKKDQSLLKLDQRPFDAKILQAQAKVSQSKQTLLEAKREYERAKVLFDRMVLSNKELQLAQSEFLKSKAANKIAAAQLQQEKLDQSYSLLQAPFAGMVAKINVEVGQSIVSRLQADPLLLLVDNVRMIARVNAPAAQLDQFIVGNAVSVQVGDKNFPAEVVLVAFEPIGKKNEVYYQVDISFTSKGQILRAGQTATVTMP